MHCRIPGGSFVGFTIGLRRGCTLLRQVLASGELGPFILHVLVGVRVGRRTVPREVGGATLARRSTHRTHPGHTGTIRLIVGMHL